MSSLNNWKTIREIPQLATRRNPWAEYRKGLFTTRYGRPGDPQIGGLKIRLSDVIKTVGDRQKLSIERIRRRTRSSDVMRNLTKFLPKKNKSATGVVVERSDHHSGDDLIE